MSKKKLSIKKLFIAIFGGFFLLLNILGIFSAPAALATGEDQAQTQTQTQTQTQETKESKPKNLCEEKLGALSWRLCPETDKAGNAADWMYEKIEEILVINPVAAKDGEPVYEIWKYCRDVANIVFVIFLLVITFSQITGVGINNYGIKKALPKLIIAAILVNLSFVICSLAVDVSNIIGLNLRGVFNGVESSLSGSAGASEAAITYTKYYDAITAGGILSVAGIAALAIESSTIWMLIPTVLASLISVIIGLITVAMRQAVVVLLVMVAPLAIVAYILPNTEDLFKRWKKLFIKMLVFFPMMSLLFGAADLAGWAIMRGASNGFMVLLGKAVQFFPLFISFKLMKMSDTVLGTISGKLTNLTNPLIASNTAWAKSHRDLGRARMLANEHPYTPYSKLSQFLSKHKIAREADTAEELTRVKNKGLAYRASRNYDKNGNLSRIGRRNYGDQAYDMKLAREILRDKNNFEEGFSDRYAKGSDEYNKVIGLDIANVDAADDLFDENVRTALIAQRNAEGRHNRYTKAIDAHMDEVHQFDRSYRMHEFTAEERAAALERYNKIRATSTNYDLNIRKDDAQYTAAEAAAAYKAQADVRQNKFNKYFDMTVPTQDVIHRLSELTTAPNSSNNMDAIIAGLRVLNARGDTSKVEDAIYQICDKDKLKLGTYASQALASFLMFEVKGNSPGLRRFGKFINLETARTFNDLEPGASEVEFDENGNVKKANRRFKRSVDFNEYINSEYDEEYTDPSGQVYRFKGHPKRGAATLLNGTDFKTVEREAFDDIDTAIKRSCTDASGKVDMAEYIKKQKSIFDAILPNLVGDQFSYLSGSEQILALGQFVTGKRPKEENGVIKKVHKKDENGNYMYDEDGNPIMKTEYRVKRPDFYKDATDEEKAMYDKFIEDRIGAFWGAQVPNQVARAKSDVLMATQEAYTDIVENEKKAGLHEGESTKEVVRDKFRSNFKPETLRALARSYNKGNQGDTKVGLVDMLGYKDEAILRNDLGYAPNNVVDGSTGSTGNSDESGSAGPVGNADAINYVEGIFSRYQDNINQNVTRQRIYDAYNEVLAMVDDPSFGLDSEQKRALADLGLSLVAYTSTAELREDVMAIIEDSD